MQQDRGTHQDAPGDLCHWDVPSHWAGVINVQTPHGPGTRDGVLCRLWQGKSPFVINYFSFF